MLWLELGRERFPVRQGETTIGRSNYCTIVLDSTTASRQHAAIVAVGDTLTLTDLKSRNGTAVNGIKIKHPTVLGVGDVITLGSSQIALLESSLSDDTAATVEREIPSDPRLGTTTQPDGSLDGHGDRDTETDGT
jgi:pSer/pThr/pTyr-binding forkhead associated (FHA) protein